MENRVGEKYTTNEGYKVEIIEYLRWDKCTVQFEDGCEIIGIQYDRIKKGKIKNPLHKSVFGIGCIGVGIYKSKVLGQLTDKYLTWNNMLERCYSKNYHKRQPTYKGCTVTEEWHNFQVFAQWFEENYTEGFALDKDILLKGNKIYSPETCCFVPQEINTLFKGHSKKSIYPVGVTADLGRFRARIRVNKELKCLGYFKTTEKAFEAYKKAKEKEIKDTAKLCKNILPKKVYQALINYKIEITD